MSDRIDHAAEAAEWIADAPANADSDTEGWQAAIVCGLLAQAEATLALVEQQRLANLISLAALAGREDVHEELAEAAHESLGQLIAYKPTGLDDEVLMLHPTIAAALGIEAVDHD